MSFEDRISGIQTSYRKRKMVRILGTTGFFLGLLYAFRHRSGIWGYAGYSFVGAIMGGAVGGVIGLRHSKDADEAAED